MRHGERPLSGEALPPAAEGPVRFGGATQAWFEASFEAPTRVQVEGWRAIAAGAHTLMLAPTGSGKTLAAFLWCIDRLLHQPEPTEAEHGYRVLYISPIKALAYDIERNLRTPLIGIKRHAQSSRPAKSVTVDVRTGDTPTRERRRQARHPGEILITTPESLFLLLGSRARANLRGVTTVIVDEIHALAGNKRGVHLALSLERLSALTTTDPQRIGLSATQRPLEEIAHFLGGDRAVHIVDASEPPALELQIVVPVPDMQSPLAGRQHPTVPSEEPPFSDPVSPQERRSIWPAIYPKLLELIEQHRSTIVFVNSRRLAERLARQLNELSASPLVRAHHGSLARHQRKEVEQQLKAGQLRGIVATSSLELGIDMDAVDLVIQIESPKAVARGLQRLGRAGHGVGQRSRGFIFPKFRADLLEAAVVAQRMRRGEVEALKVPRKALDVLAQQLVAACADHSWHLDQLEALVRRTYSFHDLSREALVGLLDLLSGRYPSDDLADLRPRISWDRHTNELTARKGARLLCAANAGTIADRGSYAVHLGSDGPRVGELDEEMVYESRPGDVFLLGASSWRIEQITRDRVIASPAPGEPGRMPFWRGEGPGRPLELGRALGRFVGDLEQMAHPQATRWLRETCQLDHHATANLLAYLGEQREATGALPTDRTVLVERFRDELGDWRVCILSPFGARVHAPWALALEARLSERTGVPVRTLWHDDGIVFRLADGKDCPSVEAIAIDPDELQDLLLQQLSRSALFASHFRQNAARALLLPRRRPGARAPLWAQRLRAQQLMAVAMRFPSFPIVLETYRECLQDVFDLPGLTELMQRIQRRQLRLVEVETSAASPFARSLVFAYVATYLYEGDAPLAEHRAQALTVDASLLGELLGQPTLRELLDTTVIRELERELQQLSDDHRARDADELHDLLRRVGDLSQAELARRTHSEPGPWLALLEQQQRVARIRFAEEERFIANEDAGRYRDALGVMVAAETPPAFLEPREDALEGLLLRWARRHGPFIKRQVAEHFGLTSEQADRVLQLLVERDALVCGEFWPDGIEREWCHPEVLRQLRRRTLARYRAEVAPVDASVLGRFLPAWQGVSTRHHGIDMLRRALDQLQGIALPFSELEQRVLPARVADFQPRMLDQLGAAGELVWVGRGALGPKDGRVALYTRPRVAALLGPPSAEPDHSMHHSPLHQQVLETLRRRGASFLAALAQVCVEAPLDQLNEALWDLVWTGQVTNDTFEPLRALRHKQRGSAKRRTGAGGRWSLVSDLVDSPASGTDLAHARALMLLDRYGIATRDVAATEDLPGGFAPVAVVLRAMEEAGQVRRGYFVDGLDGMQFASSAAIDRLRQLRDGGEPAMHVLATCDPANPYGLLLPWPATRQPDARPSRRAGTTVVLRGGRPILIAQTGHHRLQTFADAPSADVVEAVRQLDCQRALRLDQIDGQPAHSSPFAAELAALGFRVVYRSLER